MMQTVWGVSWVSPWVLFTMLEDVNLSPPASVCSAYREPWCLLTWSRKLTAKAEFGFSGQFWFQVTLMLCLGSLWSPVWKGIGQRLVSATVQMPYWSLELFKYAQERVKLCTNRKLTVKGNHLKRRVNSYLGEKNFSCISTPSTLTPWSGSQACENVRSGGCWRARGETGIWVCLRWHTVGLRSPG